MSNETGGDNTTHLWVLPEPAWSLADFTTQCYNDTDDRTAGALILYDIESDAASYSWLLYQHAVTHLYAKALFVKCERGRVAKLTSDSKQMITNSGGPPASKSITDPANVNMSGPPRSTTIEKDPAISAPKITQTLAQQTSVASTTTDTTIPSMTIVWQNDDNLSAYGHEIAIPFVTVATLGAYIAQRTTRQVTTTSQVQEPSSVTVGKTATNSQQVQTNTSDIPLGLALIASSVSGLNSASIGGSNQTRMLKTAAAGLATRLINLLADDCYNRNTQLVKADCPDPLRNVFNFSQMSKVERVKI